MADRLSMYEYLMVSDISARVAEGPAIWQGVETFLLHIVLGATTYFAYLAIGPNFPRLRSAVLLCAPTLYVALQILHVIGDWIIGYPVAGLIDALFDIAVFWIGFIIARAFHKRVVILALTEREV